jgi:hypothetical protein
MDVMTKSARVLQLEQLLRDSRIFVSRCNSIGAQRLSTVITETLAVPASDDESDLQAAIQVLTDACSSETPTMFWDEAMRHVRVLLVALTERQQEPCNCGDPLCLRSAPNQEQSHD